MSRHWHYLNGPNDRNETSILVVGLLTVEGSSGLTGTRTADVITTLIRNVLYAMKRRFQPDSDLSAEGKCFPQSRRKNIDARRWLSKPTGVIKKLSNKKDGQALRQLLMKNNGLIYCIYKSTQSMCRNKRFGCGLDTSDLNTGNDDYQTHRTTYSKVSPAETAPPESRTTS